MAAGDTTGATVQIRRRVSATAEQIFDLWTKPDLMVRWMSPFPGAVDCKASCDLRPGGAFSLVMSSGELKWTPWLGPLDWFLNWKLGRSDLLNPSRD
jgi:uncharacterized protein YndB with AHSA1/START domain